MGWTDECSVFHRQWPIPNPQKVMAKCPKCHKEYNQTDVLVSEHHIIPRRFEADRGDTICLCRACHDALETHIPLHVKLTGAAYFLIVSRFLFS